MTNTIIRAGDRVRVEAFEFDVTSAGDSRNGRYLVGDVPGGAVKVRASQATKIPRPKVGDRLPANASLLAGTIVIHDDGIAAQVRDDGTVDILHGSQGCAWAPFAKRWQGSSTIAFIPGATAFIPGATR